MTDPSLRRHPVVGEIYQRIDAAGRVRGPRVVVLPPESLIRGANVRILDGPYAGRRNVVTDRIRDPRQWRLLGFSDGNRATIAPPERIHNTVFLG